MATALAAQPLVQQRGSGLGWATALLPALGVAKAVLREAGFLLQLRLWFQE